MLHPGPVTHFPVKGIWVLNAPSILAFFCVESSLG